MQSLGKKHNKLRSMQERLIRSSNSLATLNFARQALSVNDYMPFLTWAFSAKRKGIGLLQNYTQTLYPKKLSQLKLSPIFTEVSPEQELAWCCALIILNRASINRFISIAEKIEACLLNGEIEQCLVQIEQVERDFGKSIWALETKTAILQYSGGIESQKNYLKTIKEHGASNIPWLASTYSQRNEETTTYFRFANQLIDFLADLESDSQRDYLLYRSLDLLPSSGADLASILRHESNASIIDIYLTLIRVLQDCISENGHELKESASKFIELLDTKIADMNRPGYRGGSTF